MGAASYGRLQTLRMPSRLPALVPSKNLLKLLFVCVPRMAPFAMAVVLAPLFPRDVRLRRSPGL